jgi:hypothetical protein
MQVIQKHNLKIIETICYDDLLKENRIDEVPIEVTVIPALLLWQHNKLVGLYEGSDVITVIIKMFQLDISVPKIFIDETDKNLTQENNNYESLIPSNFKNDGVVKNEHISVILSKQPKKEKIKYQQFSGLNKEINDRVNASLMAKNNIRGIVLGQRNDTVINMIKSLPKDLDTGRPIVMDGKCDKSVK